MDRTLRPRALLQVEGTGRHSFDFLVEQGEWNEAQMQCACLVSRSQPPRRFTHASQVRLGADAFPRGAALDVRSTDHEGHFKFKVQCC